MNRPVRLVGLILCCTGLALPAAPPAYAQDSTRVDKPDWLQGHSPREALRRAALAPGWGQIYNRQYYKLPFVYAGLAGSIGFALYLNNRYLLFRHAYLYRDYQNQNPNPYERYKPAYDRISAQYGSVQAGALRDQRDIYRRNRDLSYFGIGLFYGLTVLDAYVSAHLLDFDVGEDLTIGLRPSPAGVSAVLHVPL